MKIVLEERFDLLLTHNNVGVYDVKHAVEEWKYHFPNLALGLFFKGIKQGLDKIKDMGNYMFVSKKNKFRIPVEYRIDRMNRSKRIAAIPTVLSPREIHNTRNEIEVLVENKNLYQRAQLIEGFNYYLQRGKIFSDFEEVEVD